MTEGTGSEANQNEAGAPGPLDGVRVLEFSQIVAGPFCGVVLSDLGAEVVKVEAPETGDPYRNTAAVVPGHGKRFQSLNRGKQSLVVDLGSEAGRELIHRIIPDFDVLVINFRTGVPERLGIGYETLSSIHPGLIYCRITGFGATGPAAQRTATDPVMEAFSGLMAGGAKMNEDGTPRRMGATAISDYTAGQAAATAICAALYSRGRTGKGQLIDTSLLRAALALQDTAVMREPVSDASVRDVMMAEIEQVRANGGSYADIIGIREGRAGMGMTLRLYARAYETKDGAIMLGCLTPATRNNARKVFGITDDPTEQALDDDNRAYIMERLEALQQHITQTMCQRTMAEWMETFEAEGVTAAPVNLPEDLADDPVVNGAGLIRDLVHEVTGPQRVVGPIVEMSATPTAARSAAPLLGGHTDQVLGHAGLSAEEIASLREAGALG